MMIRRLIVLAVLLSVPLMPLLSPAPVNALTDAECRQRFKDKTFADGSDRLRNFSNSDCTAAKGGVCVSAAAANGRSYKITCYQNNQAAKDAASRNNRNAQTINNETGGITDDCGKSNNICVGDLPRTEANQGFVKTILNIVIGILAAVSVLFVAIGGLRYIFSQGDPQAVSKAKSTIVYALIGLVVALLAQGIVTLVLRAVS